MCVYIYTNTHKLYIRQKARLIRQIEIWLDRQIYRQIGGQMDRWMDRQIVRQMDRQIDSWTDGRTDGGMDRQMDGWIDGYGWMDGWMDGWMERQMDGYIYIYTNNIQMDIYIYKQCKIDTLHLAHKSTLGNHPGHPRLFKPKAFVS